MNLLKKANGNIINLGGKTAVNINAGDIFSMLTPGGGGCGKQDENLTDKNQNESDNYQFTEKGSLFDYRMQQESV